MSHPNSVVSCGKIFDSTSHSLGGGGSVRDIENASTIYSSLTERTESSTLPQDKLYENLVGMFKQTKDINVLRKQKLEIKDFFDKKIANWRERKSQLMEEDKDHPIISRIETRIKKSEKLAKHWTEEIRTLIFQVTSEELDAESQAPDLDKTIIIDPAVVDARITRTESWVTTTSIHSEASASNLEISVTQETAESSQNALLKSVKPTKISDALHSSQNTVPKSIEPIRTGEAPQASLIQTMNEFLKKPVKDFKELKRRSQPLKLLAKQYTDRVKYLEDKEREHCQKFLQLNKELDATQESNRIKMAELNDRYERIAKQMESQPMIQNLIHDNNKLREELRTTQEVLQKKESDLIARNRENDDKVRELAEMSEKLFRAEKETNEEFGKNCKLENDIKELMLKLKCATVDPEIQREITETKDCLLHAYKEKEKMGGEVIKIER